MIRGVDGRDLSRDLDRHITGNYGEDQFRKRGRMSQHNSVQHPAVGQVACPYCGQPRGVPCVTTGKRALIPLQRTETHNARVRAVLVRREDDPSVRSVPDATGE